MNNKNMVDNSIFSSRIYSPNMKRPEFEDALEDKPENGADG